MPPSDTGSASSSTTAKNAAVSFPLTEAVVMRAVGIHDRADMRSLRAELLTEGTDWARVKERVMYSDAGAQRLTEQLRLFPATAAAIAHAKKRARSLPSSAKKAALNEGLAQRGPLGLLTFPGSEPPLIAYVRRRQTHHNRTVLLAELPGVGPISIRVRDYGHFLPNTPTGEVLVRPGDGHLWEFAGRPGGGGTVPHHPRAPGRW
jgi:hypothetical protein